MLTDKQLYIIESSLQTSLSKDDFQGVEWDQENNEIRLNKDKFQDLMDLLYPGRYRLTESEEIEDERDDYIIVSEPMYRLLKLRFSS